MTPKANQRIYEPIYAYICNQILGKILFTGFWDIACCDLDVSPFDLISMSQVRVHTSPNFGEISSNIYEAVVFTMFSASLPAVNLTFDL